MLHRGNVIGVCLRSINDVRGDSIGLTGWVDRAFTGDHRRGSNIVGAIQDSDTGLCSGRVAVDAAVRAAASATLVDTGCVCAVDFAGVGRAILARSEHGSRTVGSDCDAAFNFLTTICSDVFFDSGDAEVEASVCSGRWATVYELCARLVGP